MANTKVHHGKIGFGTFIVTCGNKGGQKAKDTLPQVMNAKMFAYIMAVDPEVCCAHCVEFVSKQFPNNVKNAAADPEAFAAKHNLM